MPKHRLLKVYLRIQSDNAGVHGTTLSPLGPKHTIELPRIEGMSSHAERFSCSAAVGRPYLQQPILATDITQGKRRRSNVCTITFWRFL